MDDAQKYRTAVTVFLVMGFIGGGAVFGTFGAACRVAIFTALLGGALQSWERLNRK